MILLSPGRHASRIASLFLLLSQFLPAWPALAQATRGTPPATAVLAPPAGQPTANLAPSIQSISPSVLSAGNTYDIVITGGHLSPRAVFSFGDGIETVGAPQPAGGGQLRLTVRVLPGAIPGLRVARVTAGHLSGQGPATLSVIASTGRSAAGGDGTMLAPPPLLPPGPERGAAPPSPPKSEQPAQPVITQSPPAIGASAQPFQPVTTKLAFGITVVDANTPAWGPTERNFDKNSALAQLVWSTPDPAKHEWRWQVALQPFTASEAPPALLGEGNAHYDHFDFNLSSYIPAADNTKKPPQSGAQKKLPPASKANAAQAEMASAQSAKPILVTVQPDLSALPATLYIRLAAFQNGKPAGAISNTVIAHYEPGLSEKIQKQTVDAIAQSEAQQKATAEQLGKAKKIFELKILSFQPAVFPDPNLWGCVVVVSNPYAASLGHPLSGYPSGKHCPPTNPKYQQKSAGDWIVEGITGWGKAWDGLAGLYNKAKAWAASQIANTIPCDWLGKKLEDECKDATEQLASYAISAGLAAAGLPPSLPDLSALSEAGKGKIADAAVEASCQTFENNGFQCTPEIRDKLRSAYKKALDDLQKQIAGNLKHQAHEPGCGDSQTANKHGLLPLPCFSDYPNAVVKPATGSVYEPPRVKVRITRKTSQPKNITGCNTLSVSTWLSNKFEGGYLGGKNLPPANVSGAPYKTEVAAIPVLVVGKSAEIAFDLNSMAPVTVPGNYVPNFYMDNWMILYWGGKGTLSASVHGMVDSGSYKGKVGASCATGDSWQIQIPK